MTQPRWLGPAQARAWLGYRRMRALLDLQVSRDLAKDSGLSDADYDVLSNVSESAGQSMRLGDLAAHMLWSKSRLSHHVARMERRGLVARQDCPSDGRGAILTLTEAGWRAITTAAPKHVESVRRHFVDLLTDEQIRVLGDLTETVLAHLGSGPAQPGAARRRQDEPSVGRHRPEELGAGRPGSDEPGVRRRGPDEPDSRGGATARPDKAESGQGGVAHAG